MLFSRSCPEGRVPPIGVGLFACRMSRVMIIVETNITYEKCCRGFGFITQFRALYPAYGRNNDTRVTSHRDDPVITREFHRD